MLNTNIINVRIPWTFVGPGAAGKICDMVAAFTPARILLVTDAGVEKAGILGKITTPLQKGGYIFDVYTGCEPEAPTTRVEELCNKVKAGKYDLLIGVGGGSVMDATKTASAVVANNLSLYEYIGGAPVQKTIAKILVPTTSGTGSEWSLTVILADDKAGKKTRRVKIAQNLANGAIIDPELSLNLPPRITADTGLDAFTHAYEAYMSPLANIISDMAAEYAMKLISENLRAAHADGKVNTEARYNMAIGASLGMWAMALSGAGLVHIMNDSLGKKAHVSHGTSCTLLLPYIMEFNLETNLQKYARLAELMGENVAGLSVSAAAAKSVEAVKKLIIDLGMPLKASGLGISREDIPAMVKEVQAAARGVRGPNFPEVTPEDVARIYGKLF